MYFCQCGACCRFLSCSMWKACHPRIIIIVGFNVYLDLILLKDFCSYLKHIISRLNCFVSLHCFVLFCFMKNKQAWRHFYAKLEKFIQKIAVYIQSTGNAGNTLVGKPDSNALDSIVCWNFSYNFFTSKVMWNFWLLILVPR